MAERRSPGLSAGGASKRVPKAYLKRVHVPAGTAVVLGYVLSTLGA